MRIKAAIGAALATVVISGSVAACGSDSDSATDTAASTTMMSAPADMAMTGTFSGLNDKMVAGDVSISGDMVTLTGFSSDEGPDLHLYLTNGTDEAAVGEGMEIGKVAYDKASQTFMLPDGDASGYTDLVVHCDKAKAVFGAASLS